MILRPGAGNGPGHYTMHPTLTSLLFLLCSAPLLAAASTAALLPGGQLPDGQRVQATFLSPQPAQSFVLLSHRDGSRQVRPGSDLGEGLVLDQVMADRIIVLRQQRRYYLPLQAGPSLAQRPPARRVPGNGSAQAGIHVRTPAAASLRAASGDVSAHSLEELRSQCGSAQIAGLSAERRSEMQALGLCP